jgi:biofilm PGA synthesis N-glycosyltransferase PgaC
MHWLLLAFIVPYIFILLRIFRGLKKIKPYIPDKDHSLFVSVIVACRNEEKRLPLLLKDIARQSLSPNLFELIIVDDNSYDSTINIASGFTGIKNLKVLKSPGKGKKKALRTGIGASSGSLVITTDADCSMDNSWMETIVSYYCYNKPDIIICPVRLENGKGFFHRFQQLEFLSLQGITAGTAIIGNPVMCNGASLAFRKELYLKHSGNLHDELASGDDIFLLHSIKRESPKKILWLESPSAIVTTGSSDTLHAFLTQRARWISKTGYYTDRLTKLLAIVTFVTILLQTFLLAGGLFSPGLLLVFLAFFVLKSLTDYLILENVAIRYGETTLLRWFLPSQIIYPFYIIAVVLYSLWHRPKESF